MRASHLAKAFFDGAEVRKNIVSHQIVVLTSQSANTVNVKGFSFSLKSLVNVSETRLTSHRWTSNNRRASVLLRDLHVFVKLL